MLRIAGIVTEWGGKTEARSRMRGVPYAAARRLRLEGGQFGAVLDTVIISKAEKTVKSLQYPSESFKK